MGDDLAYLECFGEEVTLLHVVLFRVEFVNIEKTGEATGYPTMRLERLHCLPSPFPVLGVLGKTPHYKVRLEGLQIKRFMCICVYVSVRR